MALFVSPHHQTWVWVVAGVFGVTLIYPSRALSQAVSGRPPLSVACRAWQEHISGLLNQHRTAHEISDEEFGDALQLFYAAQSACDLGEFTNAQTLYSSLPLGRVRNRELH